MNRRLKKKIRRLTLKDVKDIRARVSVWGAEEYALYLSSSESLRSNDRKLADDFLSVLRELRLFYDAFLPHNVSTPAEAFSYIETLRQQVKELTADRANSAADLVRHTALCHARSLISSLLGSNRSGEEKTIAVLVLVDLVMNLHKRVHESERNVFELFEVHVGDLDSFVEKMFKNFH